jgi:hypothetical protein
MKVGTLLAASLLATSALTASATSAQAQETQSSEFAGQQGAPLMKGLSGPGELADLIDASLAKDSSGNTLLDEKRCKLNGSCATPMTYVTGITTWHPRSAVTLAGLSTYIRGLKNAVADGEFYSARMVGYQLDLTSGFKRKLMSGEVAWYDTQTGEAILFENCGNIMAAVEVAEVVVQAVDHCQTIHVSTDGGGSSQLHSAAMLPDEEEFQDQYGCLAHQLVGETRLTPGLGNPCPEHCDFSAAERDLGLKAKLFGNVEHLQAGWQTYRVPKGVTISFCYVDKSGRIYKTKSVVHGTYNSHGEAWILRSGIDTPDSAAVYWRPKD